MLPAFICKYRAKNFVYSAVNYAVQCTTLFVFQELRVAENSFQKPVSNSKRIWHSEARKLNIPTAYEKIYL
jgi:hypothetical protein